MAGDGARQTGGPPGVGGRRPWRDAVAGPDLAWDTADLKLAEDEAPALDPWDPVPAPSPCEAGKPEPGEWTELAEADEEVAEVEEELRELEDHETLLDRVLAGAEGDEGGPGVGASGDAGLDEAGIDLDWDDAFAWEEGAGDGWGLRDLVGDTADPALHSDDGLFEFEADARRSPWEWPAEDDERSLRNARGKAATIAAGLDVRSTRERHEALAYLTDLFMRLAHPRTFRALLELVAVGMDLDTLRTIVELRRLWTRRPEWWLCHRGGGLRHLEHGSSALSWKAAYRIWAARATYPVESMIAEEWLGEWLTLAPFSPGYVSFTAYIDLKVRGAEAEDLAFGLLSLDSSRTDDDWIDGFNWYRVVPDRYGVIGQGFPIGNPFDQRELLGSEWNYATRRRTLP